MELEVYHAKPDKIKFGMGPRPKWPEDYEKVAVVMGINLDDAFQFTNTIDHPWQENKCVKWYRSEWERSTSVDDVVVKDGKAFRCEMAGWSEI